MGVDAIDSSSSATTAAPDADASAPSSGGLDAELSKAKAELSDWVTCPSSKTPEGKAKIAQVTAKLAAIEARVKKAKKAEHPASEAQRAKAAQEKHAATQASGTAATPTAVDPIGSAQAAALAPRPRLAFSGIGGNLDVRA